MGGMAGMGAMAGMPGMPGMGGMVGIGAGMHSSQGLGGPFSKKKMKKVAVPVVKDKNCPKRPRNSYIFFTLMKRDDIKKKHPEFKPTEITKMLGEEWQKLSESEKESYGAMAEDDKKRYQTEMEHYDSSNNGGPLSGGGNGGIMMEIQGASYLVLLQFVSRMLTFTLNQVLLRFTSAETLGIASVQLELLLNTILFLSREGVRCAAIRVSDDISIETPDTTEPKDVSAATGAEKSGNVKPGSAAYKLQKFVNMVYAPIPVGALMTCIAVAYYLSQVGHSSEGLFPGYRLSIYLYGLSALIELLAEPMFMVAQYKLWFKTRVSVEGVAVIVRCVLTCALTVYGARASVTGSMSERKGSSVQGGHNTMGVLAFAIAQFTYGLLILGGFLLAFWSKSSEKRDLERRRMAAAKKKDDMTEPSDEEATDETISIMALLPRRLSRIGKDGRQVDLLKLAQTLTIQSVLKHVLTEGDKMMMTSFSSKFDQGVYAFVLNYADVGKDPATSAASITSSDSTARAELTESQVASLVLSRNLLLTMMKFHVLLGLVFIAFGTHYTATLIDLVVGQYWSRQTVAPAVLALYCYYVPIMGLNGITEAVVQAVASDKELSVLSYWMVGFSAVFCSTGAFLMWGMGLGAKGIVLANCVNLSMRILWSMWFLSRYFGRYIPAAGAGRARQQVSVVNTFSYVPWRTIIPNPVVLVAFGTAYAVTALSERWVGWERLYNKMVHLSIGVATFGVVMAITFVSEKQFLRDLQNVVRKRRR
ncbi:Oligosaccharide translocation protein rft1 [Mortierella alpina]|uniref:Man(5)GlcNAc(2)-PP-dolichol translocation protein RFT1 n=1 Tax=Mortierella alpina TaxID=64518 RepID=A0A9P6J4T5_MORAP|nr:Oligosaccharide translocation protein rft1 [Mortierella alpina]